MDILLEFLLSGALDLLLEVLFHAFGAPRDARSPAHPVLAGLGLLILGGAAGGLTTLVLPGRLWGTPAVPGASLIISPLLNGALMHYWGARQARRHAAWSFMATFWGGALFAFGFASVRLAMVTTP